MDKIQIMMTLLRAAVCGTEVTQDVKTHCTPEMLEQIYKIAAPQGITGMVGQALSDAKLLGENGVSQAFRSSAMQALFRYEKQNFEFQRICTCLEQAQIVYVPLKGSVVRKYYPQPWLRTSCDIDILVKEEDLERAVSELTEKLGYTQPHARSYHDISLFSENGIHLELHFSLRENDERLDRGLTRVWEYASSGEEGAYRRDLRADFLVFHIVCHAAYHFMESGCGARPLLDLWLLKHNMGYDEAAVRKLCAISGIEVFYDTVMQLSETWFAGAESTPFLDSVGSYILGAGFGGSMENAVATGLLRKGGKVRYVLSRLFLPLEMLTEYYPVLARNKWLMPFCQVHRWFDGIARRRLGSAMTEMKISAGMDRDRVEQTAGMLAQLGLDRRA